MGSVANEDPTRFCTGRNLALARAMSRIAFLVPVMFVGCAPVPVPVLRTSPVRFVAGEELPKPHSDKALVLLAFSPCEHPAPADLAEPRSESIERSLTCRRADDNRIRVVEHGGRFVADVGFGEYMAVYEEPGHHRYDATHRADRCALLTTSCVGVLDADLEAGKTYLVDLRWRHIAGRWTRPNGRLEIASVSGDRESDLRAFVGDRRRVVTVEGNE